MIRFFARVAALIRFVAGRGRAETTLDDELRAYIDMAVDEHVRDGMSPDEAARRARIDLGGIEQVKELTRQARLGAPIGTLIDDIRYAGRMMRKHRSSAIAAVLTIAIGIGASTSIFSVVNGVLLRPLPYSAPDELVLLQPVRRDAPAGQNRTAHAELLDFQARGRAIGRLGAVDNGEFTLLGPGPPEQVAGAAVTPELLRLLGVPPSIGRTFTEDEGRPGGPNVAILSYSLWQRRFGSDPALVGEPVELLEGGHYIVVGVMPEEFRLPADFRTLDPGEIWIPLVVDPSNPGFRGSKDIDTVVGRLTEGRSLRAAQADIDRIVAELHAEYPESYPSEDEWGVTLRPPKDAAVGPARPYIIALLVAVGLVLLVACANAASLMLAQTERRRSELALRTALGAARGRIVRQMVTESFVLTATGGVLGLLFAIASGDLLRLGLPADFPRVEAIATDARVFAFTATLSLLTTLFVAVVPALRASDNNPEFALQSHFTAPVRLHRFGTALIITELALSATLLAGAGLLLRTFIAYNDVDPGFRSANVATMRVSLPGSRYPTPESVSAFYSGVLARVRALPGVEAAAAVRRRPLQERMGTWSIALDDDGANETRPSSFPDWQVVTYEYADVMGLSIERGRFFDAGDDAGPPGVVVVNSAMARAYWPGQDDIGKRLRLDGGPDNPWVAVVGIVGDVMHESLGAPVAPKMYLPHAHYRTLTNVSSVPTMNLAVRTSVAPSVIVAPVQSAIWRIDPELPITSILTMNEIERSSLAQTRLLASLLTLFALAGVGLAAVGTYGLVTQWVHERYQEIGIRMAMGATPGSVLTSVLGRAAALSVGGLALGLGLFLLLGRFVARFLFRVEPFDPLTLGAVLLLLPAVALLAGAIPARRAAGQDVGSTLRNP